MTLIFGLVLEITKESILGE